uniref:Uncharacterized protein n=1 Tax=Aegilops tauschii subsp. strangulata TaxID=200361 RepID=A0A452Y590_AEGTS
WLFKTELWKKPKRRRIPWRLMFMTCVTRLYEKYSDYVTSEDKETLTAKLQEVEDWLYEDGE